MESGLQRSQTVVLEHVQQRLWVSSVVLYIPSCRHCQDPGTGSWRFCASDLAISMVFLGRVHSGTPTHTQLRKDILQVLVHVLLYCVSQTYPEPVDNEHRE